MHEILYRKKYSQFYMIEIWIVFISSLINLTIRKLMMNENQTTDDSIFVDDITDNQSGDVPQHFLVEDDLPSFARDTERTDRVVALQVEDDSL